MYLLFWSKLFLFFHFILGFRRSCNFLYKTVAETYCVVVPKRKQTVLNSSNSLEYREESFFTLCVYPYKMLGDNYATRNMHLDQELNTSLMNCAPPLSLNRLSDSHNKLDMNDITERITVTHFIRCGGLVR